MTFVASHGVIYVDYRVEGGTYNFSGTDQALAAAKAANPELTITRAPFDTKTLNPGESWELPEGAVFVNKRGS